MLLEPVEAPLPQSAAGVDPPGRRVQGPGGEAAPSGPALLERLDEASLLECPHMLEYTGQRHVQRLGELRRACRCATDAIEDLSAGGICQGGEDAIEIACH